MGESVVTSPWLSLWESWLGKAETERVNVDDLGGRSHSKKRRKALSVTCGDSSPKGRAKVAFSICFPSAPVVPTIRNVVLRLIHRLRRSPFPEGQGLGWYRSSTRVTFATFHGDESSPLHCVVPFIRTGYNRNVPGTAHRPFPTVSLIGSFLNQRILKTDTCVAQ